MELFGILVIIVMLVILGERVFSLDKKLFGLEDRLSGENHVTRSELNDLMIKIDNLKLEEISEIRNKCNEVLNKIK